MGEYKMKRIIIVILLALSLVGCSTKENKDVNSSNDYKQIMEEKEYIVIDVRTKEEYDEGHVKGSINIPYDEINKDSEIAKEKVVFVYCRSGVRSKKAYETLKGLGFEVYDLGAYNSLDLEKE